MRVAPTVNSVTVERNRRRALRLEEGAQAMVDYHKSTRAAAAQLERLRTERLERESRNQE